MSKTYKINRIVSITLFTMFLIGCKDERVKDAHSLVPLERVSLFGVQIGMTPADINSAIPGAHCVASDERARCDVPSTALGSSGLHIEFTEGVVSLAQVRGEVPGGSSRVMSKISQQLGSPRRTYDPEFSYGDYVWVAADGSELMLSGPWHAKSSLFSVFDEKPDRLSGYFLTLSSAARRSEFVQHQNKVSGERVAAIEQLLSKLLSIGAEGRLALCGITVGGDYSGSVRCGSGFRVRPDLDAEGCARKISSASPERVHEEGYDQVGFDGCLDVAADAHTRRVREVELSLVITSPFSTEPVSKTPLAQEQDISRLLSELAASRMRDKERLEESLLKEVVPALGGLFSTDELSLSDSMINSPGSTTANGPVRKYENNNGDVLTVAIPKTDVIYPSGVDGLISFTLSGRGVTTLQFN